MISVPEDDEEIAYPRHRAAVAVSGYDGPDLTPAESEISATVHVVFALGD